VTLKKHTDQTNQIKHRAIAAVCRFALIRPLITTRSSAALLVTAFEPELFADVGIDDRFFVSLLFALGTFNITFLSISLNKYNHKDGLITNFNVYVNTIEIISVLCLLYVNIYYCIFHTPPCQPQHS